MLARISGIVAGMLAVGIIWGCGKGNVANPIAGGQGQESRLAKLAGEQATHSEVLFTLTRNGRPVNDAIVEFKYPAEGNDPDLYILTIARTDAQGQVSFMFWPKEDMGQYQARAWEGEDSIGSWENIPINRGYKVMVDLSTGKNPTVTGKSPLTPIYRKPIDWDAPSATSPGSGGD